MDGAAINCERFRLISIPALIEMLCNYQLYKMTWKTNSARFQIQRCLCTFQIQAGWHFDADFIVLWLWTAAGAAAAAPTLGTSWLAAVTCFLTWLPPASPWTGVTHAAQQKLSRPLASTPDVDTWSILVQPANNRSTYCCWENMRLHRVNRLCITQNILVWSLTRATQSQCLRKIYKPDKGNFETRQIS